MPPPTEGAPCLASFARHGIPQTRLSRDLGSATNGRGTTALLPQAQPQRDGTNRCRAMFWIRIRARLSVVPTSFNKNLVIPRRAESPARNLSSADATTEGRVRRIPPFARMRDMGTRPKWILTFASRPQTSYRQIAELSASLPRTYRNLESEKIAHLEQHQQKSKACLKSRSQRGIYRHLALPRLCRIGKRPGSGVAYTNNPGPGHVFRNHLLPVKHSIHVGDISEKSSRIDP
jgi:hypothetical protein